MEKTDKLVSIVLPVYNTSQYLNRCLDSLVNQTYKNIELIIVDDKSTDDSPQICDAWQEKDSRIKVVHKEKNEGLSAARNTGMKHVTGDYVAFFDSDDFVDKTLVEKVMAKMVPENADIAWYGLNFYFGEGRIFPMVMHVEKDVFVGREIQDELFPDILEASRKGKIRGLCGPPVWIYILSMDFVRSSDSKFESERKWYLEDLQYNFHMYSKLKKAVIIPENLYYYNLTNTESLTARKFSLDKFIKLRMLIQSMFEKREELGYIPEVDLRIQDLFVSLTIREIVQLAVNRSVYEEEEFKIMLEHIISDELFYKCLTAQDINANWSEQIQHILNLVIAKKYDESIDAVVKIVNENKAIMLGLFAQ